MFQNAEVTGSSGTPKDMVTDSNGTVTGNIGRWQAETFHERLMTITMEMSLLIGIPNRYDVAQEFGKTSPFGSASLHTSLKNALPVGTRFSAIGDMEIAPQSFQLYFANGMTENTFNFPRKSRYSVCYLNADQNLSDDNYRQVTQFTLANLVVARDIFNLTLLRLAVRGQPSAAKPETQIIQPDPDPTVSDFLNAMGSLFNIILPQPGQF